MGTQEKKSVEIFESHGKMNSINTNWSDDYVICNAI